MGQTLTDPDGPPPSATAAESTSSESHVPPPTLEGTSGSSTNDPPPPPPVASRQDRVTAAARVASGSRYGATLPADSGHAVQEERGRMLRGDGAASVTGEERRESMDVEVENDVGTHTLYICEQIGQSAFAVKAIAQSQHRRDHLDIVSETMMVRYVAGTNGYICSCFIPIARGSTVDVTAGTHQRGCWPSGDKARVCSHWRS